ncbi:MAG: DUF3822 family protein [Bacteroidales bacterium]
MTNNVLDFTKSEQYSLSIRLRPDGFSFYVTDPNQSGTFYSKDITFGEGCDYNESIKKYVFDESYLLLPYRSVSVLMDISVYQLIPNPFFDREYAEDMFYTGKNQAPGKKVMINSLRRNEYHLLFEIDHTLFSFLTRTFGINRVYAHISPLMEYFSKKAKSGNSKAFVCLGKQGFDICVYKNGILQAAVNEHVQELNDYLFHILSIWQTFGLDQYADELYICGENHHSDELNSLLKRYIHKVSPVSSPLSLTLKEENIIPLEIQTLPLCEL